MAHEIEYIKRSEYDRTARCVCGWTPDPRKTYRTHQMVEDEVRKHHDLIARIGLHLANRNPSLKSQWAYYESMANDPNVSESHREQWRILADGLASRIGKPVTRDEQPELFHYTKE